MRMLKRKLPKGSQEYATQVEINDVEQDVMVIYSECAPEPDVGFAGGVEIEGVYFEDQGCVMSEMSEDQLDALALEIGDYNQSSWEAAAEAWHERD